MKLQLPHLAVAAAIVLTSAAFAQERAKEKRQTTSQEQKPSAMDKAWASMTAMSDQAELKLAKAAQEKGQSEHVKQHAQKIIQDHQKTSDELKQIAKSADIDLKADIPAPKKAMIEEITSKSGAEFDQAYMEHEIAAHRMAIAHFQNGAEFLKNEELKSFAQKTLPVLQQHLQDAERHSGQTTRTGPGTQQAPTATSRPATQPSSTASSPQGQQQRRQSQQPAPAGGARSAQPQQGQVQTE